MARKKKVTWPKVTVGSHSTRTEYEDGTVEFVSDWNLLMKEVKEAIKEYESKLPKPRKKRVLVRKKMD